MAISPSPDTSVNPPLSTLFPILNHGRYGVQAGSYPAEVFGPNNKTLALYDL